jgi:hypothetical protein
VDPDPGLGADEVKRRLDPASNPMNIMLPIVAAAASSSDRSNRHLGGGRGDV